MNKENESALSRYKIEYEHGDDTPFLRLIGGYKRMRRQRQARQAKEPVSRN